MEEHINNTEKDGQKSLGYSLAKRIALVAAVLAGVLSVLMITNFIQIKSVDPLNSQAISARTPGSNCSGSLSRNSSQVFAARLR